MRRMITALGTLALAFAIGAPAAFAQAGPRPAPTHRVGPAPVVTPVVSPSTYRPAPVRNLTQVLSLTPRQAAQLRTIERNAKVKEATLERQLAKAKADLATAQRRVRPNRATVARLTRQIAQLERQLRANERDMLAKARAVLTSAQYRRYASLVSSGVRYVV